MKFGARILLVLCFLLALCLPAVASVVSSAPPPILAELTDADKPILLMWAVLGLNTLISTATGIVTIWAKTRQQPPNHAIYATKEEVSAVADRVDNQEKVMSAGMEGIRKTVEAELRTINKAIGQLEGYNEAKRNLRSGHR